MKRRHKIGLTVLVAILVLALSTALAYSILSNQYFEDVAKIQFEHGFYDDWTLSEKVSMLKLMKEYEVDIDAKELDTLIEGDLPNSERETRIDKMMIDRYGINGRSDVIGLTSILETELGEFDSWTMEQKAWYSQMLIDSGLLTLQSDDDIFRMPPEGSVTPDEAMAAAKQEIASVWGLSESELAGYDAMWIYRTHASDEKEELLHYEVYLSKDSGESYSCPIGNDGKVLSSAQNHFVQSPAEQKAALEGDAHKHDSDASELFMAYEDEHGLTGQFFGIWPLEDKKAVTDELRPVILEHMAADPEYANLDFSYTVDHIYGLPDDKALNLEQAIEAARKILVSELGVDEAMAAKCTCEKNFFYEVTDPNAPVWRITLAPYQHRDAMDEAGEEFNAWIVRLNAYTGENIRSNVIDYRNMTMEEVVEINR